MTTREVLERPFPAELVKHRTGRDGQDLTYVEGHVVIARLNEAFDGDWSFEIERHETIAEEVVVLGKLTAGGITKMAFGSWPVSRSQADAKQVSVGDDLKCAATDALKKAASLLGVALNLYGTPASSTAPSESAKPVAAVPPPTNANGRLSAAQLRAIHAIRRRLDWSETELSRFLSDGFGRPSAEDLDKKTASAAIDRLQEAAERTGAAR